ncbi:MAG: hypothetical protein ABI904_19985 [Chloroflexota bacterium]
MKTGKGQILEIYLDAGVRMVCPPELIPAPGQYLLASDASDSVLPVPLFYTDSAPEGFIAAPPAPHSWMPGLSISLRGPLGRGFAVPVAARKIALVAFDDAPSRLRGLIRPALKQGAAVVVVSDFPVGELSDDVEVQPSATLHEVLAWADYAAFDVARENLFGLREKLGTMKQASAAVEAQVLIRTAMPCGGVADCAACAVSLKSGWQLACKDGPVFDLREI